MQDQGQRTTEESSIAATHAARATVRACNAAVQIHGGYGYTREFDVERYLRDAKLAGDRRGDQRGPEDGDRARAPAHGRRAGLEPSPVADAGVPELDCCVERVLAGDLRAAASLMRALDDELPGAREALRAIYPHGGRAFVVGAPPAAPARASRRSSRRWWGPPRRARRAGRGGGGRSLQPFSGGALFGDRVRMSRHATDDGVFIRSLATRGHHGGLACDRALAGGADAAGFPVIFVETVGKQAELDVADTADAVVVVTAPGLGDEVQALNRACWRSPTCWW